MQTRCNKTKEASERNSASSKPNHSCEKTSTWIDFDSGGRRVDLLFACHIKFFPSGGSIILPLPDLCRASDYLHHKFSRAPCPSSLCRIASGAVNFRSPPSTMSDSSDAIASTSPAQLLTPPPKPSTSPPFADTVVRPFTSQGSSYYAPPRPSDRPSTGHSPNAGFDPYVSASARTSYTRVDVDSLSVPEYPPLPALPIAFATQDAPAAVGAPATTTTTTMAMTPAPTNGAQTPTEPPIPQTPQVSLTFLLVSGNRKTQSFEPETTVGRVKELVWNAWPARDSGSSSFPPPLRDDRLCCTDVSFRSCSARLAPPHFLILGSCLA